MNPISRREFVMLAAAGAVAAPPVFSARTLSAITAQEIVDRIKQKIGAEWKPDTLDTFKAGDPSTPVHGIVTTTMATMPVLRLAVKAGANLVITCEPTFYSRSDAAAPAGRRGGPPALPDAVFAAKNEFIKSNGMVIWRFSDHWRQRKPDPLAIGLTDALGWAKLRAADDAARVTIPAVTLDELASDLKKKLKARGGIRVVGDRRLKVQKIGLLPGTTAIQAALHFFPGVDAVIAGEVREWESVEYVHDKVIAGEKKALILLGRVVSEDPGMNECALWVKAIVPEVTTKWIPVGDPYWRPA
jgi:putative NIF3 family GTP cyclohydrolase 1 type 2